MKGWIKILLLVIVVFLCVGTFYYLMFSSLFEGTPRVARDSYLQLDIYGELPERESPEPIARLLSTEVPTMNGLLECLRKAKIDDNILGVILRPLGISAGWGKLDELKQALEDFKSSGKKVYVYLEMASNREYYLALSGDMIFGPSEGLLFINGLMGGGYFIKGTLDKIGVKADFIKHGKYKDYPEMFTRTDMSPAAKQMVSSLLDDIYKRYLSEVSDSRQISQEQAAQIINTGLYSLKDAFNKDIIDTLLYYNDFKGYLKQLDQKRPRLVSYHRYKNIPFSKLGIKATNYFALIYAVGTIVSGYGNEFGEDGLIVSESMAANIKRAAEDKSVKAIVIRIDSPGGSGTAADIIWNEINKARSEKPVVVSISSLGASGGYYLAMPADSIFAEPSSIVGSIGVFSGKFSLEGLYKKLGINKELIPRGKNADIFSETTLFSENQRKIIQNQINEFYRDFVSKAAEGRHMTYQEVDEIAQGRVWTGSQAIRNGLVDRLGGLDDAMTTAKIMAGIPPEDFVKLKIYPQQQSYLERLLSSGIQIHYSVLFDKLPSSVLAYMKGFLYYHNYEPLLLLPFYPEIQ
jgi:protease-4